MIEILVNVLPMNKMIMIFVNEIGKMYKNSFDVITSKQDFYEIIMVLFTGKRSKQSDQT